MEAYFSALPQPPVLPEEDHMKTRLATTINDEYLQNLEMYIDDLSSFIRDVQKQEVRSTL